ncbi:S8 family serine peptidase [Desulfosarcina sp.]|uniref:S8 family serine peptidase n=1 Tax=Desulfosarcina sp. TaxID=2027861 RepID=UPI003970DEDC
MRCPLILVALVLVLAANVRAAAEITPDLLTRMALRLPDDKVAVIIEMADQVKLPEVALGNLAANRPQLLRLLQSKAAASQKVLKDRLQAVGADRIIPFWVFNGISARVPADRIETIAALPEIRQIRMERVFRLQVTDGVVSGIPEWNINAIRAPELWAMGFTGQGVVVANMDSGVDINHPDLFDRWRGGANSWFDAFDPATMLPRDGDGHGTATMSLMVGGDAGGTVIGVAPGARWIAARVFDDQGDATTTTIHQGFQWLLDPDGDPDTPDAPDVVNNSWSIERVDQCDTEFEPDVRALKAVGIAVVFSAGNYGPDMATSVSPANYPDSFAVGAVDDATQIARFSSRGPTACPEEEAGPRCGPGAPCPQADVFPHVVAPGTSNGPLFFGVKTAYPFGAYLYREGTSFAAPHAAGAMALLMEAFPGITVAELEAAVQRGAVDLGDNGPDDVYGHGMLDAVRAHVAIRCPRGGRDRDRDGIPDSCDNCTQAANPDQRDTDGDGFGNMCDPDLNDDLTVNILDYQLFIVAFGTDDPHADFNGDGSVNIVDYQTFINFFGKPPGPSGLAP